MSPDLLAAVRQQMCNMVDAANFVAGFNLPPNMTMQTIAPNHGGGGGGANSSNIQNPKAGSPASMHQLNKNGGESSNILQMPRLDSPSLQNLPAELSLQGLQNLSPNDDMDFRKLDKRLRKSLDDELEEQQKALNNNRLSITKMNSPCKTPSMESLEPAVNLAISSHTLDMSYKSRNSSDGSVNGDDMTRSFRNSLGGFKSTSPIKLEPLADCRE